MKPCIECIHFSTENMVNEQPRCARFGKYTERFNVVYGVQRNLAAPDCKDARAVSGQCGPSGRSWTPRYGRQAYTEPRATCTPPQPVPEAIKPEEPPKKRWWQYLLPA